MVAQREIAAAVKRQEGGRGVTAASAGICPRCKMGRMIDLYEDESQCYVCSYTLYQDLPRIERESADSHFQGNLHIMRYVGHERGLKDRTIIMLVHCPREDLALLAAEGRREASKFEVEVDCPFCGQAMTEIEMWGSSAKRKSVWRLKCPDGHLIHARKTMDGWL